MVYAMMAAAGKVRSFLTETIEDLELKRKE
jgi:hypothetical protein